jgi:hypothetical protein
MHTYMHGMDVNTYHITPHRPVTFQWQSKLDFDLNSELVLAIYSNKVQDGH